MQEIHVNGFFDVLMNDRIEPDTQRNEMENKIKNHWLDLHFAANAISKTNVKEM